MPDAALHTFRSTRHPGDAGRSLAFARAYVRPLAACLLPVMIVTLVSVLQQQNALVYVLWGYPGGMLLAALWTWYRLTSDLAEVHVGDSAAATRTVWEAAQPPVPLRWEPILDLRRAPGHLIVALGYTSHELSLTRWPDAEALLRTLGDARDRAWANPPAEILNSKS